MLPPLVAKNDLPFESLSQVAEDLKLRRITSQALVERCISQINKLEPLVHAWVLVDAEGAMASAAESDQRRLAGAPLSSVDGIPFGVKDIIDVSDWPTVAGFPPWHGKIAEKDAAIISLFRQSGMIPLGKTVTTQFASIDPPHTQNPFNPNRTPGGSSSGSCAAVASRMVPLALGSQTGGSINRPASFCGVAGLKMPFGAWPVKGVVPCSPTLDTLGPIVNRVADLVPILLAIVKEQNHPDFKQEHFLSAIKPPHLSLKIARLTGRFAELADTEMIAAVDDAQIRLESAGAVVETVDASDIFNDSLWKMHREIMLSECYLTHAQWFADHSKEYLPKIRAWVEEGREIRPEIRSELYSLRRNICIAFYKRFHEFDAILVPAARGEAPTPETTGDPVFNAPWTLLGVPSLTVPIRLSSIGLPLGVQLVAISGETTLFGRMMAAGIILDSP